MKLKHAAAALTFALALSAGLRADNDGISVKVAYTDTKAFREAVRLYENGMYSRSRYLFDELSDKVGGSDIRAYSVLCDIRTEAPGYEGRMKSFIAAFPHSVMVPQMRYYHALNLFDAMDYEKASEEFYKITDKDLYRGQRTEYTFKKAYCDLEAGRLESAKENFMKVEQKQFSDYSAPSRYAVGYIEYQLKNFPDAITWFGKASFDNRFKDISNYYILECRFMLNDYKYVTDYGVKMYETVPADRKAHLARIISESFLVQGDAESARRFYELSSDLTGAQKSRADLFFSGSVLYAVEDYKGAVENYSQMTDRTDSLGQIANYHMGYSYIQMKDKVSALTAFKDASAQSYDPVMAEDAFFNYAKLAFDINNDTSAFREYLKTCTDKERGETIYSYMAVAALYDHDYAGAIDAYDQIDELDADMKANYMKANYLRADQLIRNGSYRMAIPCLKAAAYYSDRNSRFNQLARFWLAESYYRNDQYSVAREEFADLYNVSALYGQAESYLIPYNIAYCFFKEGDYAQAKKWFGEYLGEKSVKFRKEALLRKADCDFVAKDYKAASAGYDNVVKDYFDVNDIYPYYQSALSYGLMNKTDKKISLLSNVMGASPTSEFYPEAMFELGRSYAVKEDTYNAYKCFNTLAETVKDSTYVAKAYIEMGSLARNESMYNEALAYYKIVVEKMPMSEYADDALAAIESIYQSKNDPEEYIAYIESIGKGSMKTADEKENMIFNSAEQIFLSENYQKALVSLQSYKDRYPTGSNVYKADFYMAESYKALGKYEHACDCYEKVVKFGEGSFVELSMLNYANLSYRLERWEDAYGSYSSLYTSAKLENNTYTAAVGMMRSAFKAHMWPKAIADADRVGADQRADEDMKLEARYVKAKSYLASSMRYEAFAILEELAKDPDTAYGAEAAYLMILDSYDRGEFEQVENRVYAFSDAGSGQVYWLAKSFIVLGDSFMERDDIVQAKATFESVRDGYSPSEEGDDVQDNVKMRLKKIEDMSGNAQN